MNKQKQAFTLVELIVVITILAILGTIAIMAFSGYSKNARDSARLSDIGNMKKSLELWILQSGTYPDPSSGTGVTYSGATVWLQGTFGDSVTSTVGKLDKKPVDPKYDTEYTYSVTQSKKEYQIGAVLEKDMASNIIVAQTYAATAGEAYVSGTYNGILTTVGTNPTYIVALPSIILSSLTTTELKTVSSNTLVYEGKGTLPASYANVGLTMTGSDFSFTPTVVWSGSSIDALNNQNEFQNLVTNLQTTYQSNPAFATLPEYTSIVSEGDKSVGVMSFVKGLLETNTSKELTNVAPVAVNFKTCNAATKPADNGHISYTENPSSLNQTYVQDGTECGYNCTGGFTGIDCNIVPETTYAISSCPGVNSAKNGTNPTRTVILSSINNYIGCSIGGMIGKIAGFSYSGTKVNENKMILLADQTDISTGDKYWGPYMWDISTVSNTTGNADSSEFTNNIASWDGLSNTKKIIAEVGAGINATHECYKKTDGGQEWYLPAIEELNQLYCYSNVANATSGYYGVGVWSAACVNNGFTSINTLSNFVAGLYWSSSEMNSHFGRSQYFSTGMRPPYSLDWAQRKYWGLNVRCVSRF